MGSNTLRMPWKQQIANGRVFEFRSKSKYYLPPCGLVIDETSDGITSRMLAMVDKAGVVGNGLYTRSHNPHICVNWLRRDRFTSARIVRRRRDLERFDAVDLALIRYGYALDFDGRIHGYPEPDIPLVVPSLWTVFWIPAYAPSDFRGYLHFSEGDQLDKLLRGAWYFTKHGGPRHLGYKFGHMWATRHDTRRVREIKDYLSARFPELIVQECRVARRGKGDLLITTEIRRDCPPLGLKSTIVHTVSGEVEYYV